MLVEAEAEAAAQALAAARALRPRLSLQEIAQVHGERIMQRLTPHWRGTL